MLTKKLDSKNFNLDIPVLIVDDYSAMLKTLKNLLIQLGLTNIDEANNGQEALDKTKTKAYGLIISDCNMAPISGRDLLKEIKRQDPETFFIMVTANCEHADVLQAKKAGVTNYILKPFTPQVLKHKLEMILKKD